MNDRSSMRINVIDHAGTVQASDAFVPAGQDIAIRGSSVCAAVRVGDWVVDSTGTAGPRPTVVPLPHTELFASAGVLRVQLFVT